MTETSFWPMFGTDPVLDDLYRACGYRVQPLPPTAAELLDRLREIGYRIGKGEDLGLQDAVGVLPTPGVLDRNADEAAGGGAGVAADGALDAEGAGQVGHEESSRCGGAGTPASRSVEVAADSAAGVGLADSSRQADPSTSSGAAR